jgi:hypothetical protein
MSAHNVFTWIPGMSYLCKEGGDGYSWPCYDATREFSKDILYLQVDFSYALVSDCVVACFGSDLVPAHYAARSGSIMLDSIYMCVV